MVVLPWNLLTFTIKWQLNPTRKTEELKTPKTMVSCNTSL